MFYFEAILVANCKTEVGDYLVAIMMDGEAESLDEMSGMFTEAAAEEVAKTEGIPGLEYEGDYTVAFCSFSEQPELMANMLEALPESGEAEAPLGWGKIEGGPETPDDPS